MNAHLEHLATVADDGALAPDLHDHVLDVLGKPHRRFLGLAA